MSTEQFEPQRLADAVNERMEELDLSNESASLAGGPSTTTLSKIRNARPTEPRTDVYRKLDKVLRWKAGSAKRLARTGQAPSVMPAGLVLDELLDDVDRSNLPDDAKKSLRAILMEPGSSQREVRGA